MGVHEKTNIEGGLAKKGELEQSEDLRVVSQERGEWCFYGGWYTNANPDEIYPTNCGNNFNQI